MAGVFSSGGLVKTVRSRVTVIERKAETDRTPHRGVPPKARERKTNTKAELQLIKKTTAYTQITPSQVGSSELDQ